VIGGADLPSADIVKPPRHPLFGHLAFYASLFLSRLADQVLLFLVPLVVFQTTHSAAWSGVAFFVETLPRFLCFPVCGALCDRFSPLFLLRTSQRLRGAVCLVGMAGFAAFGGLAWLVVLSALCGIFTTQGTMAREVMLPQIFHEQRFEKVAAQSQIADQLGTVLGPLVAALLLNHWHWAWVVSACALVFVAADACLAVWRRISTVVLAAPQHLLGSHWLQPYRTGLRHVRRLPGLKQLIVITSGVNLVLGATLATSAAMLTGWHQRSNDDYALLQTAGAVVTVVILVVLARVRMPLFVIGVLACGGVFVGGLVTAVSPGPWGYALGFMLVVGFDKMVNVFIRTHRARMIPAADLGKTTGIIAMLNNLSQPLAGLLVGAYATGADSRGVILVLTLGMGLMVVTAAWSWRRQLASAPGQ
jgi:MFS family permease